MAFITSRGIITAFITGAVIGGIGSGVGGSTAADARGISLLSMMRSKRSSRAMSRATFVGGLYSTLPPSLAAAAEAHQNFHVAVKRGATIFNRFQS